MNRDKLWIPFSLVLVISLAPCQKSWAGERTAGREQAAKAQPVNEKLLTPADIEKVTGLKGIKVLPRQEAWKLTFALHDGAELLMITAGDAGLYKQWRQQPDFLRSEVKGVGDEAFEGPAGELGPYVLSFRKGNRAVSLSSFFDPKLIEKNGEMKPLLTMAQLRELAKVVLSRL